jgi:hypothetical protein
MKAQNMHPGFHVVPVFLFQFRTLPLLATILKFVMGSLLK